MLSPDIIKKIKKIHFKSAHLVNTFMAGQYRSVFRGTGMEFEEVREYSPGDDVKHIDWKVSARLGKPFVKLYREERELVVMLLLDMSASGRFGTADTIKQEVAAEIAAVLAFNAIRNNDKVGAILFTDRVEKYIPPQKGSSHVWRVIREIFSFVPRHKGTEIGAAVHFLGQVCRKKSVAFLISDFIVVNGAADYSRQVKSVAHRHEIIAVMVSDPGEYALPPGGILSVQDLETGQTLMLDASDRTTRKTFLRLKERKRRDIADTFKKMKIDCVRMGTESRVADELTNYFRLREKRKK